MIPKSLTIAIPAQIRHILLSWDESAKPKQVLML